MSSTPNQKWISAAAMTSAILAVLSAICGVKSTYHGNQVTRELIRNVNQWNYYQAKGIKANLLQTKLDLLNSLHRPVPAEETEKLKEYRLEQDKSSEKAKIHEAQIEEHVKFGGFYTRSVMFFQIAIGVVAVAILTRKNTFWFAGLAVAAGGIYMLIQVLLAG